MVRVKRRRKATRYRGSHTHGRGFKKKARGSGHQGGKGMAGTGKRGDAKKTLILNLYGNDYFGKDKTLRRGSPRPKLEVINLADIMLQLPSLTSQGRAKDVKGTLELDLNGYKILGEGDVEGTFIIKASAASQTAIAKVRKSGGQLITSYTTSEKETGTLPMKESGKEEKKDKKTFKKN